MSLVETWGGSGSNVYVSYTNAASYITTKYDYTAWTNATTVQREASLLQATDDIDYYNWIGERYYYYQSREWPRTLTVGQDDWPYRLATVVPLESSLEQARAKERIQKATCEQALYILDETKDRDEHLMRQQQGIVSISETVGPISESYTYKTNKQLLCMEAMKLVKRYFGQPTISRG